MDPNDFINLIAKTVLDGIQKAPPKPFSVFRKPSNQVQNVSLGQLMAEMSDNLIVANNLQRDHIKALVAQTEAVRENTKVGRSILKMSKKAMKKASDDDDDDDDGG